MRRTIVAIIACKMKNWLREIPAVVRTSRETGEKNTSPLSREVRSSASVFIFAFILIHLVIFGFNIRNKQWFHEVRKTFFFICTALFEIDLVGQLTSATAEATDFTILTLRIRIAGYSDGPIIC